MVNQRANLTLPPARKNEPALRVIIGATILGLGGIRTHLLLLCGLLRSKDVEVVIFATGSNWDAQTVAGLKDAGVKFVVPPRPIRRSQKLSAIYSAVTWTWRMPRRANSLYCISPGHSQLLLNRLKPRGAVSINHEIVEPPTPDSTAGQCAAGLDVTVANSRKVARRMQGFWPQKPIRSIPFLTSDRPTPPPTERRRFDAQGLMRVTYLGRLVEQKRPDQLVRRWQHLRSQPGLAPARLDVYGYDPNGQMLMELRDYVNSSGLSDSVCIHGEYRMADLSRILEESDLVVLPSLWEGLPLVLVEAMLRGVPFVASAAGGTEELGEDNPDVMVTGTDWVDFETGFLAMARKVRAGIIDSQRLHRWVEKRYGYTAVSEQWLSCLLQPTQFFGLDV
jgi:glycosyltransferase involved in cell wall biosynthesis